MSVHEAVVDSARQVLNLVSPILRSPATSPKSGEALRPPTIIGLTGLQGSGKSTWATALVSLLEDEHGLKAITVSLDDFYKNHDGLIALRDSDSANKLFRTRGQPGTHDTDLAESFFALAKGQENLTSTDHDRKLKIPVFDKSKFSGEGDRAPEESWPSVDLPVDVIVFEGWCVGFQPLSEVEVQTKHAEAVKQRQAESGAETLYSTHTLADHKLEHLLHLNQNLARYNSSFMGSEHFDCFVHLDTNNLANVYTWRLDQEDALRKRTGGQGMTEDGVVAFVKGYMPAYELYLEQLKKGFFTGQNESNKTQVRVELDLGRKVIGCEKV